MGFRVVVIYYSRRGRLVTLAHVIAEGARKVPGAEVHVYRVRDPVNGDDPALFEEGILDAPVVTPQAAYSMGKQAIKAADAIILGAPGRQGGMAGEMRLYLDTWAPWQSARTAGGWSLLKGKVGAAFTSVGGEGRGYGGHEAILQSFHATFLQHGMVIVGSPPSSVMEDVVNASPHGIVMGGRESADVQTPVMTGEEVALAYGMGEWAAQVAKLLHDTDMAAQ